MSVFRRRLGPLLNRPPLGLNSPGISFISSAVEYRLTPALRRALGCLMSVESAGSADERARARVPVLRARDFFLRVPVN
jgi:hypothetical protein